MNFEQGDQVKFKPGIPRPTGVSLLNILTIACVHVNNRKYYLFTQEDSRGNGGSECNEHRTHWVVTDQEIESATQNPSTIVNIRNIYSQKLIINHHD